MVLVCVRIKNIPPNLSDDDIESEWSDLNIVESGIEFLDRKVYYRHGH